jgi:thymidylate synthase
MIAHVLTHGTREETRTGVKTLTTFGYNYTLDISESFPLLTTKKMDGKIWASLVHELIWYLSGVEHIQDFRTKSKIWNAWATEEGHLETAYGRFWRAYPTAPSESRRTGEVWSDHETDQIAAIVGELEKTAADPSYRSRRMILNAWHPGNATKSKLPPCHAFVVFSVQGDKLHCHLTQRSGDIGLGIPFNIACYALLTRILAKATGLEVGVFGHTIIDAHIYCGEGAQDPMSHVAPLELQLQRAPYKSPQVFLRDRYEREKPLDYINSLRFEDVCLNGYTSHGPLKMNVAV